MTLQNSLANFSFISLLGSMIFYWIEASFSNCQYSLWGDPEEAKQSVASPSGKQRSKGKGHPHLLLELSNVGNPILAHYSIIISNIFQFSSLAAIGLLLLLRWKESGHYPLSNLYESLMFLSWCFTVIHIFIENYYFINDTTAKDRREGAVYRQGQPHIVSQNADIRVLPTGLCLPEGPSACRSLDQKQPGSEAVYTVGVSDAAGTGIFVAPWCVAAPTVRLRTKQQITSKGILIPSLRKGPNSVGGPPGDPPVGVGIPYTFTYVGRGPEEIVATYRPKIKMLGAITTPSALLTNAFATFTLPKEMQEASPLVPALQSNWLMMHVTVMILSYAALIIGSLLAVAFLVVTFKAELPWTLPAAPSYERPQERVPCPEPALTPLSYMLDNLSYRILGFGFPFLTIGILSGAVWANEAWGSYWSWDPKETWALLTWLIFAIYLHTRLSKGWEGRIPAIIASFGFVIVWVCFLGVNLIGEGLHSYGWLRNLA